MSLSALLCAVAVATAVEPRPVDRAALWKTAQRALEQNRVQVGTRRLLTAGRHQFRSMWTRDFAFASRGLLAMGDSTAVRDQLDTILEHTGAAHLVPRVLDTMSVPRRVIVGTIQHRLGLPPGKDRPGALRAQVLDEHGSPALDSNLLVVKTALDYADATGDSAWLEKNRGKIEQLYRYYDAWKSETGLLHQPKWSDWQDSAKREGQTFYLNLLYADVTRRLGDRSGLDAAQRKALYATVHRTFWDEQRGLYRSMAGRDLVSLDGNLLALDLGFVKAGSERAQRLYGSLKTTPLWTRGGVPGSVTFGDYPRSWLHLPVRLTGLTHYHDELHWSWLVALSAKVAHQMGDREESERILGTLGEMVARDGTVAEVYEAQGAKRGRARPPKAFGSLFYRSEAPFSWGAGFVLDALAATAKK